MKPFLLQQISLYNLSACIDSEAGFAVLFLSLSSFLNGGTWKAFFLLLMEQVSTFFAFVFVIIFLNLLMFIELARNTIYWNISISIRVLGLKFIFQNAITDINIQQCRCLVPYINKKRQELNVSKLSTDMWYPKSGKFRISLSVTQKVGQFYTKH